MRRLGTKVATLAKLKKVSQGVIAEKTGISRISINRFFTGKSDLRATDLIGVLDSLGIDFETEIDTAIDKQMNGSGDPLQTVSRDVTRILEGMAQPVRKTILEQILWWGRFNRATSGQALNRIENFLGLRARVGESI